MFFYVAKNVQINLLIKTNKTMSPTNKNFDKNNILLVGVLVRLKTSNEEHRGKYFKVENTDKNLIKVSWKDKIYHFYHWELEVVQ